MAINGMITTTEAARLLGVSTRTVQRLAADGKITVRQRLDAKRGVLLLDQAEVHELAHQRRAEQAPMRAEVLREAADAWHGAPEVAHWLRDRADDIERGQA